jgi:dCTP deaminase
MTLLKQEELLAAIQADRPEERLVITPLLDPELQVDAASIDLRLSTQFIETHRRFEAVHDPFAQTKTREERRQPRAGEEEIVVPLGERLALHPGQFLLGATLEFIGMPPNMGGQVLGRSSWGRIGLIVATAVVVQPGFRGCLTLELVNMGPVPMFLYPGLRIAQLQVWRTDGPTRKAYGDDHGKYHIPLGPQSTKLGWELPEKDRISKMGDKLRGRKETPPEEPEPPAPGERQTVVDIRASDADRT